MKKYKLLKDLPTFKAGEIFYRGASGHLHAEDAQGMPELIAYRNETLKKYPAILTDWFEEVEDEWKPWKPWRARNGETYYCLDGDNILKEADLRLPMDDEYYEIGNYFRTEEEAQRVLAKLKAYQTVKRDAKGFVPDWEDRNQVKCFVLFDHENKNFYVDHHKVRQRLTGIYFMNYRDAEHSLKIHLAEWELLFDLDKETER